MTDLELLAGLRTHADDPELHSQWRAVRRQNKARMAAYIEEVTGVAVSIDAMFDVQVKRIHEYKRQLLNVVGIIHRYTCIKVGGSGGGTKTAGRKTKHHLLPSPWQNMSPEERRRVVPRVCILGGKAAPGYEAARRIIKLITTLADCVNNDTEVGPLLKLVFIPDYNVSVAEIIVPAADLSQHIRCVPRHLSLLVHLSATPQGSC